MRALAPANPRRRLCESLRDVRDSRWLQEIRTLDPERDCRRIVFLDAFCEFPFGPPPARPEPTAPTS
jgi:hypothetical protein